MCKICLVNKNKTTNYFYANMQCENALNANSNIINDL